MTLGTHQTTLLPYTPVEKDEAKKNRKNTEQSDALFSLIPLTQLNQGFLKEKRQKSFNTTAYRIFKIATWLIEAPRSVEAFNHLFCKDPLIGKSLSNDSIWLYINTLKALGFQIQRPSPKNQFQYEMLSHPFGLALSEPQFEVIVAAKIYAQLHLSHHEIKTLDGVFKKVLTHSIGKSAPYALLQLFEQSRSLDTDNVHAHQMLLEQAIQQSRLLCITYLSPLKRESIFCFLPEQIFYEQGVMYVRGERPENQGASNLRIDRVKSVTPVSSDIHWSHPDDQSLIKSLRERRCNRTQIILRILATASEFSGFGLQTHHGVYEEEIREIVNDDNQRCQEVRLKVRDWFYLKQRLLACGYPFQILTASDFKQEVQAALSSMLNFYQTEGESSDGRCQPVA